MRRLGELGLDLLLSRRKLALPVVAVGDVLDQGGGAGLVKLIIGVVERG